MVLTDNELGAWRNSEVAKTLVAMLEDQACMMCEDEDKVPEDQMPPIETEMRTDDDGNLIVEIEEVPLEALRAELDLHNARMQLAKLASAAVAVGNLKAAYLIERAAEELD